MLLYLIYLYYGTLSPGWHTLRAFSKGQHGPLVLWLKYWVIYALLQGLGCLTDFLFDGILLYKSLKLILSALLWMSSPYSTNLIYTLMAVPVAMIANRWHISLGRQLYRFFWSSDPEDNHGEQKGEPLVNGKLLKRELDALLAEIAGGEPNNQESNMQRILNNPQMPLTPLDRQAIEQIVAYLGQHYPDQQPESEQQRESSHVDY